MNHITTHQAHFSTIYPERLMDASDDLHKFMEAFFAYNGIEGNPTHTIETLMQDIQLENMVKKFADSVREELGKGFVKKFMADPETVYANLADFYREKGTTPSIKFFFRALFDQEIDVYFPSHLIFKSSDNIWVQNVVMILQMTETQFNNFLELWQNQNSLVAHVVEEDDGLEYPIVLRSFFVRDAENFVLEVYTDREKFPQLRTDVEFVKVEDEYYSVLPALMNYEILDRGYGFEVGSRYTISQGANQTATFEVVKVDKNGSLLEINPIKIGYGYSETFNAEFNSCFFDTVVYPIEYEQEKYRSYVEQFEDTIALRGNDHYVNPIYFVGTYTYEEIELARTTDLTQASAETNVDFENSTLFDSIDQFVDTLQISCGGEVIRSVTNISIADPRDQIGRNFCGIARIQFGPVKTFSDKKFFRNWGSFASDEKRFQDWYKYHPYSYVVASEIARPDYGEELKKTAHPSGTIVFSQYNSNKNFQLDDQSLSVEKINV